MLAFLIAKGWSKSLRIGLLSSMYLRAINRMNPVSSREWMIRWQQKSRKLMSQERRMRSHLLKKLDPVLTMPGATERQAEHL